MEKTRSVHALVRAILWIFPPLYKAYMHFVLLTSKRVFYNFAQMKKMNDEGENIVGAIWHQDVVLIPFTFRDYNVVTMVSKSDFGAVMARIVERIGFIPIRGGSSMGGSEALAGVVDFFRTNNRLFCGITVDGSRGPKYKAKRGIIAIAKETGGPLLTVRAWAKHKILLSTWDNTLIPLPFNEFVFFCSDLMHVPPDATPEIIEAKRQEVEDCLMEQTGRAEEYFRKGTAFKERPQESKVIQFGRSKPLDDWRK